MSASAVDKDHVLAALRQRVNEDLDALTRSQQATHAGATHAESRPENAKDTRALESTYLARGLAERVAELRNASVVLDVFAPERFDEGQPVAVGALVTLDLEDEDGESQTFHHLITPVGGGLKLCVDGIEVGTLSPRSPLGQALLGLGVDDEVQFRTPQGTRAGTVLSIA